MKQQDIQKGIIRLIKIDNCKYNKSSAVAKVAAQCCTIRIFAVECGVPRASFNALLWGEPVDLERGNLASRNYRNIILSIVRCEV